MWPALAAIAGANVLGGVIGNEQARDRQRASEKQLQRAQDRLSALELPDFISTLPDIPVLQQAAAAPSVEMLTPLQFEQLASAGQLTPEMVQAFQQGDTAFASTYQDPELQEARMQALAQLQEIGNEGGMTAIERAQLGQIEAENARAARGAREAVMQNMNARGMGGSGMELINKLQANQAATDRGAQQSLNVAAMAQQRALDALLQSGRLAGEISREDLSQQNQVAQARDAINRFNVGLQTDANRMNTGLVNDAQRFNLSNDQRILDGNVDIRNRQGQYNQQNIMNNNNIAQQQYANQMRNTAFNNDTAQQTYGNRLGQTQFQNDVKQNTFNNAYRQAGGMGEMDRAISNVHANEAQATRDMWGSIGEGASTAAAAYFEADDDKPKTPKKKGI